jgi:hypothetical protein
MKEKTKLTIQVMVIPFVIGAALEFLPRWLSWPATLLGGMLWVGSCIMLAEKKDEK